MNTCLRPLCAKLKTTSEISCIWSDVNLLNIFIKCDHVFPFSVCVLLSATLEMFVFLPDNNWKYPYQIKVYLRCLTNTTLEMSCVFP